MSFNENRVLKETQLQENLERVRSSISNLQHYNISNIIFLNVDSIINFIDMKTENAGFRECLKEIEPYIPLAVSNQNLELFVEAAERGDDRTVESLENAFVKNSMTRFISEVYNAQTDEAWRNILETCGKIREYKNEAYFGYN